LRKAALAFSKLYLCDFFCRYSYSYKLYFQNNTLFTPAVLRAGASHSSAL